MLKLSILQKSEIVNQRDSKEVSYREISKKTGVPKSTLHDNLPKLRMDVQQWLMPSMHPVASLVRVVLVLSLCGKCSSRDVALSILKIWGAIFSHQTILKILDLASIAAEELNQELDLSNIMSAIFDEIFQKNLPLLVFSDPYSGVIYVKNFPDRSGASWRAFLNLLKGLGLDPTSVTTDGGLGMLKGISECFKSAIVLRDLFHVMKKTSKAINIIEGKCYSLIIKIDSLKKSGNYEEAKKMEKRFDHAAKLYEKIYDLIKKFEHATSLAEGELKGTYTDSDSLKEIILELVKYLKDFQDNVSKHRAINDARSYLENGTDEICAYKKLIEKEVLSKFGVINKDMVLSFICPLIEYIHQYLRSHDSRAKKEFWAKKIAVLRASFRKFDFINQGEIDNAINMVWSIGMRSVKSNSFIEAVNSVIRAHLKTYKSIPNWFPELFTFYWNHHEFKRGKRAKHAPRDLLKGSDENLDWIDQIISRFPLERLNSELPDIPQGLLIA